MAASALKDRGWFLSDEGVDQCSKNRKDVDSIIKVALDTDLREIGKSWLPEEVNRGKADYVEGPGVLQVQKIRNVSAPKDNEESQGAPRLMKLVLTDGHITCTAVETEVLKDIGSKTAPGSKIKLRLAADVEHGFLLLNNKNTQYLGGRVDKLAEGWELKKKLAKQERTFVTDGGPPPFVPFGHRIDGNMGKGPPRRDNFKSLDANKGEKKAEKKAEDAEFEQQRKATIAEAMQAKEDTQGKKFGGGQYKAQSDQDVAKIVSMGFSAEAANTALRLNNGSLQQAIDYLLGDRSGPAGRGRNGPSNEGYRGKGVNTRPPDEDRGRGRRNRRDEDGGPGRGRGRDQEEGGDGAGSKPSGPATLFDFLETKIPAKDKKGNRSNENTSSHSESNRSSESRSQYNSNRESVHSRTSAGVQSDHADNKDYSRPKSQQGPQSTVPPRFANRSKQDSNQGYGRNTGHSYDDRNTGRSYDDKSPRDNVVPKSAPSDNRNNSRYNDNRTSYSDRSDRNRNYNDRNGDRDVRGPRDTGRQNSRNSDYNDRNGDNYSRGGKHTEKQNNQSNYGDRSQSRDDYPDVTADSQQKTKPQYTSQKQTSEPRRDGGNSARGDQRSRNKTNSENQTEAGSASQSQQNYKNNSADRGYGVNGGNYGNQRQSGHYGNNQQMGGQYQQQPDYRYSEVPTMPGLKRGDKVMAKYWEDGQFYEATVEVLAPNLPTCVVTFNSYGNSEEVFLSDVRPILRSQMMGAPDFSVPPPQIFFSAGPPPQMNPGVEECIQGISSMEFRRGGGGARYAKKDPTRPPQQLYQPPGQRR